jgi:signal transduction histidine kinase/DNA-binding response OmpR family regulator
MNNFNILIISIHNSNHAYKVYDFFKNYNYDTKILDMKKDIFEYLKVNIINLIIIDAEYTDSKSKALIQKIRKYYNLNIIFLTNDESIETRKEFFTYNLLDYKIKNDPLEDTLGEIIVLVNKIINNKDETILIVKDESITRDIVVRLLAQRSYNLIIANDAKTAWMELENNNKISIIIVDIGIVNIKSHELILYAREKFNQQIPVIAFTANYDALIMQHNIEYGLSDFIQVPVIHEEFNLKIDLWINNIRQNKKLQEHQNLLAKNLNSVKALANATIEALIMFDNNICIDVNDAAIVLFEYSKKEELLGKHILDIVSSNITEYDKINLVKNSVDHEFELIMKKKNNNNFLAQVNERNISLDNKKLKIIAILDLVEKRRKENMMAEQSKMASMGEMIGNIAHQWRQPLSSISIAASNMKLSYELDMIVESELLESLDGIVESTQFLSNTIDEFRDFIKGESLEYSFVTQNLIKKVLKLVEGNIKSVDIEVIQNYEENIKMYGYGNELTQAILNIVNNARDALKEKNVKEKFIFINTHCDDKNENVIINIKDNAGGIPKDILAKIFEPYFTTKHKSQGTGLGLYMTHKMIIEHMKGEIEVINSEYEYKTHTYTGVLFKIILPI